MAKKKRDPYITLLRFGRDNMEKPVSMEETKKHLLQNGVNQEFLSTGAWFDNVFGNAFFQVTGSVWALTMESYFQLLEYEELHEARQSSFRATMLAIVAIFISSAIGVISVVIALQNK